MVETGGLLVIIEILCISLHYITLQYIILEYITLHYNTVQYITMHYITLHHITLHYITLHVHFHLHLHLHLRYITLHYVTLHYITLHYFTLHYITLHYTVQVSCDKRPHSRTLGQHWADNYHSMMALLAAADSGIKETSCSYCQHITVVTVARGVRTVRSLLDDEGTYIEGMDVHRA